MSQNSKHFDEKKIIFKNDLVVSKTNVANSVGTALLVLDSNAEVINLQFHVTIFI